MAIAVAGFGGQPANAACFVIAFVVNCAGNSTGAPNAQVSGNGALFDAGSRFLQRIAAQSSLKTAASAGNNPFGGGDEVAPSERYRTWLESYGMASRTDAQGDFAGDRRRSWGGVAGIAATIAPGATVGLSVDQSRTKIDITDIAQNGRIDLTQVGLNAAFENGPWTLGTAFVYGFGRVHTTRFDTGGQSDAAYNARLFAALTELSYFQPLPDNSRIVPKISVEWTQTRADAFVETGGDNPIAASSVTATRVRLNAGAELGHSWLVDRMLLDFSIYGRLVDNVLQNTGTMSFDTTAGTGAPQFVTGIRESNQGADAGATFSAKITQLARLYAVYDGRFRSRFTSHTGTVGVELRW